MKVSKALLKTATNASTPLLVLSKGVPAIGISISVNPQMNTLFGESANPCALTS
ncbi:MAG: hypothetical protein IPH98_19550 [Saprospiraceae bacterium]|nr:hypothetical protein [Candidatus Defluviibacterium haderslevense]